MVSRECCLSGVINVSDRTGSTGWADN